jgi:hypothetical protein
MGPFSRRFKTYNREGLQINFRERGRSSWLEKISRLFIDKDGLRHDRMLRK